MKKELSIAIISLGCFMFSPGLYAEIYKSVDANGHITYSNVPIKGATKLVLEPPATAGSNNSDRPSRTKTPENFPRVDKQTQKQRDDKRKEILQQELETEKQALAEAQKAYAEGASNPEVYHKKGAGGKTQTFRNVPKYEEKMQGLQSNVDAHEKNIELLQKELDSIK